MISSLRKLLDHMEWADARTLEGLRAAPGSNSRALELYAHVLGAEHIWLERVRQRQAREAVWPQLTLERCASLAAENVAGFRALLGSLGPDDLAREILYRNSVGAAFSSTIEDILLHVMLHGTYHRGQVALTVRAAGGTPAATDYIAFVRGAPAATRQPPVGETAVPVSQ